MPKYDVYFLTTAAVWEGVEAESEDDALRKCYLDQRLHFDEPVHWVAWEQSEGEEDEEENFEDAEI